MLPSISWPKIPPLHFPRPSSSLQEIGVKVDNPNNYRLLFSDVALQLKGTSQNHVCWVDVEPRKSLKGVGGVCFSIFAQTTIIGFMLRVS